MPKDPAKSADMARPLRKQHPEMFGAKRAIIRLINGHGRSPNGGLSKRQIERLVVRHGGNR